MPEFTDAEFWVLDLISEDGYRLVELANVGHDAPRVSEARAVVLGLVERGFAEVYRWRWEDQNPPGELLTIDAARGVLDDPTSWRDVEEAGGFCFEVWATRPEGWGAYVRAYEERRPKQPDDVAT